jgi:signal transduction histidine kinase
MKRTLSTFENNIFNSLINEIKTPLTATTLNWELLKHTLDKSENLFTKEYVVRLDKELQRINIVAENITLLAKIQNKGLILHKEKIAMRDFVMQTCREIRGDGIQLHISIPSFQTGILNVDLLLFSKIIKNLVDNAIKFSKKEKKKVLLSYTIQKEYLIVAVQDWGIGIEKNQRTAIFLPFYNQKNKANTYPGLGISLYLASKIIEEHNGKIWVKSIVGRGSTFYFSLPLETL